MKKVKIFVSALAVFASAMAFQSCNDDDDTNWELYRPTAIVTVCPTAEGGFTMNLDDKTTLLPSNMEKSPYGNKEVRALVNYTEDKKQQRETRSVTVNWMDSIRTKLPELYLGEENDKKYGNDPVEIVKDWVTVAEDGYLTLRVRTLWGDRQTPHYLNLLTGMNPDNPFELELRHDAKGDVNGRPGDALIAFNLNNLPRTNGSTVKIKLHWKSFSGEKSQEFDLTLRPAVVGDDAAKLMPSGYVK